MDDADRTADVKADDVTADLLSRLDVIEAQPLETRAASYESLHDSLARRLEADPSTPRP